MCGRFNLHTSPEELAEIFDTLRSIDYQPRYNIAPSQPVICIRQSDEGPQAGQLTWGIEPKWARAQGKSTILINARAETVATKPSFRDAFQNRRCLIPASGFYEWQKTGDKSKQPFHIGLADKRPFAFAELWEFSTDEKDRDQASCTIVTTTANELLKPIHDRMPVIVDPANYEAWLDVDSTSDAKLKGILAPYPAELMDAYPVSRAVNSPRNDSAECIRPAEPDKSLF